MNGPTRLSVVFVTPAALVVLFWSVVFGGVDKLPGFLDSLSTLGIAGLYAGTASSIGFLLNGGYRSARPILLGSVTCSMLILGSTLLVLSLPELPVDWGWVGFLLPWFCIAAVISWFSWGLTGS